MLCLSTKTIEESFIYDGTQLRSHWIYDKLGLGGDAIIAFIGPADVSLKRMVDLEDVRRKAPIFSPSMLHFIGEWFIDSLDQGILLQHLFVSTLYGSLWELGAERLEKRGNDIFHDERKLNVSICTRTATSVVMHTGVNIETHGTPVPTSGLAEMKINARQLAERVLSDFSQDTSVRSRSRWKVAGRISSTSTT